MKTFWITSYAILTLTTANISLASEAPLPEKKPGIEKASVSPASLAEAKHLLEQISMELKKTSSEHKGTPPPAPTPEQQKESPKSEATNLTISKPEDLEMHCGALSQEAMRMRDIIYTTQDVKDTARMRSHGITAAGAVGSFLIGSVTGGVGLALGGFLLDQNIGQTADDADGVQDIAEQRRTLMMGIFNAKRCQGPLEHAMQSPEIFDPLSKLATLEPAAGTEKHTNYND